MALSMSDLMAQENNSTPKNDTIFVKNENGFLIGCDRKKAEGFYIEDKIFKTEPHIVTISYLNVDTRMAEYLCYDKKYLSEKTNVSSKFSIKNGKYEQWYLSGEKKMICYYNEDKLDGKFTTFYTNGQVKRHENWTNGKWQEGECFDEKGNKTAYCSYQEQAEFVGGLPALFTFIGNELKYPKFAQKKGIEGTVYVAFVVEKDGSIVEIEVKKSVEEHLDKEALRMVKVMPRWKPGKFEGEIVRYKFTLPVKLKLE